MGGEVVHSVRNDGISHMAHLVGGAVGAAFGFIGARRRTKVKTPKAAPIKPVI